MRRLRVVILGKVVGWKAPLRGAGKHVYTPKDSRAYLEAAAWAIAAEAKGDILETPCRVVVTIYPQNEAIDGTNCLKICEDAARMAGKSAVRQGVLKDDSLKYIHEATYRMGGKDATNPRVEILFETIGE